MKKIIFFAVLVLALFLTAQRAQAYISTTPLVEELKNQEEWQGGSHAFYNVTRITESLTTLIVGTGDEETDRLLGPSAMNTVGNLVATLYNHPPASSTEYFADLKSNLGFAKPAYAQGIGFEGLKTILPIWKAFRNIAYLFFTIIFVLIGFAIMFRLKLDPQTVITIQNALPKVIIALILVTFSYAIAGLLIDLIYVIISLGVLLLAPIGGLDPTEEARKYMELNFAEGVGLLIGGGWRSMTEVMTIFSTLLFGIVTIITANPLLGIGAATIPTLILSVIALYVIFKLFLSLLKCYLTIILLIIFAPIQIMIGVIPGMQIGFGSWLKNLFANIIVFPAVALFMLLGWILTNKAGPTWTPPVISMTGSPLLAIIAFGMLLMVHKIPDIIKEAFQIKPFPYGTALGEALGPAKAVGKVALVGGSEEAYQRAIAAGRLQSDTPAGAIAGAIKTGVQKLAGR